MSDCSVTPPIEWVSGTKTQDCFYVKNKQEEREESEMKKDCPRAKQN